MQFLKKSKTWIKKIATAPVYFGRTAVCTMGPAAQGDCLENKPIGDWE